MTMLLLALLGCEPAPVVLPEPDPVVADAGADLVVQVGQEAILDGGNSVGATFTWSFGDGQTADGLVARHTYDEPGNLVAVLTVTGPGGLRRTDSVRVTVHRAPVDPAPVASSSLALTPDGAEAWVAVPEADQIVIVTLATKAVVHLPVCDEPRTVAFRTTTAGGVEAAVACEAGAELLVLDAGSKALVKRWPLPDGSLPYGVVGRGDRWWVTLQGTGRVYAIDGNGAEQLDLGPDPRAVTALPDGTPLVTRFRSSPFEGQVRGPSLTIPLAKDPGPDSDTQTRGVPNVLHTITTSPDGTTAWVGGTISNIDRGTFRDRNPLDHATTVRATLRTIDLTQSPPVEADHRKVFDNEGLVSAVAVSPLGNWLYAAHPGTGNITRLDAYTLHTSGSILDAGQGIDGLAITPDGNTLLVHAWLDRELHAYDLTPSLPARQWTVTTVEDEPLTEGVLRGKQLFHSARRNMSRDGYLSCATCHPDGRDDGQVWDFTSRGEGLRNTITILGHDQNGPLHWSGNFDEPQDFEIDIREHQGGTGLLSDADYATAGAPFGTPKAGLSADLDALAAYVSSLTTSPPSPYATTGDGGTLFVNFGCNTCHQLDLDFTDGERHDIGTIKPGSGMRLGGDLDGIDTPTLRGLWFTPPYLHDGSANTIEAAIGAHVPVGAGLTPQQKITVAAWLRTL